MHALATRLVPNLRGAVLGIKPGREAALLRGHPWVYREAVTAVPRGLKTGMEVRLRGPGGEDLGSGFADLDSPILVRRVEGPAGMPLAERIACRIEAAAGMRKRFFDEKTTNGYRVMSGEGDGVPGLVVDRYGEALSVQVYSLGLEPFLGDIVRVLQDLFADVRWAYRRNQVRRARAAGEGLLLGSDFPGRVEFLENGMRFGADLVKGQKTGFFLDQRDNRDLVRRISRGLRVANICGYTGGFSVAALAGGAAMVVTVDSARPALEEAGSNLRLNGFSPAGNPLVERDMFGFLEDEAGGKFDLVVLDPPSMARSRGEAKKALGAYRRLNRLAMKRVSPGGLLFTASCSSQVSRDDFLDAVQRASVEARRPARLLQETHHPFDHPIAMVQSESRYLHGLLLELD